MALSANELRQLVFSRSPFTSVPPFGTAPFQMQRNFSERESARTRKFVSTANRWSCKRYWRGQFLGDLERPLNAILAPLEYSHLRSLPSSPPVLAFTFSIDKVRLCSNV
ncbi:uncharacterized protein LOC143148227 [Ptiloglossa arizonensis]|uniref:uncharacterized protein LOC143148227 n=1 Tax=Ptiloglossa arizonensis TaxID=3350558 RepID=UPI003FA16A61